VSEAAWLARKFGAKIILLHVANKEHDWSKASHKRLAQSELDEMRWSLLVGLSVTRLVVTGTPAVTILEIADQCGADLIMMSINERWRAVYESGRHLSDHRFLLHSITADVVRGARCPVWIGALPRVPTKRDFSIKRILFSAELNEHDARSVTMAAKFAKALDAELFLTHITNTFGGATGTLAAETWKSEFEDAARRELIKLQSCCDTQTEIIVESGNDIESLNKITKDMDANLLIIGDLFANDEWNRNSRGYRIVRRSSVPAIVLPDPSRPQEARDIGGAVLGKHSAKTVSPVNRAILLLLVISLGLILMKLAFYSALHTTCDYAGIGSGAPKVCAENLLPK
jgi:nucleotide-binding universal stress UspA family protein